MTVLVLPQHRGDCDGKRIQLSFFPPILGGTRESLCSMTGELIGGKDFLLLRRQCFAWIETDDPVRVNTALGLPPNTKGIVVKLFPR